MIADLACMLLRWCVYQVILHIRVIGLYSLCTVLGFAGTFSCRYKMRLDPPPSPLLLNPSPSVSPLCLLDTSTAVSYLHTYMCVSVHNLGSANERKRDMCLFETGLICLIWWSLVGLFLQITTTSIFQKPIPSSAESTGPERNPPKTEGCTWTWWLFCLEITGVC